MSDQCVGIPTPRTTTAQPFGARTQPTWNVRRRRRVSPGAAVCRTAQRISPRRRAPNTRARHPVGHRDRHAESPPAANRSGVAIRGRAALREYSEVHARVMRCRHMTLNMLYEVHGERARGRATTVVTLATEGGYKILGDGLYEDELVKLNGAWRIAYRKLRTDRLVSDPSVPVNLADPDVAKL